MRRRFIIYMFVLASFLLLNGCEKRGLVIEGNKEKKPLEFKLHQIQCPQCHMEVDTLNHALEVVLDDGKTYIFDDPGCVILWLDTNKIDPKEVVIWAYSGDTHRWIDAKKAYYSLTDNTPMKYGFGAYEKKKDSYISFDEMRIKMLRGENLTNPKIRKKLLGR